MAIGCIHTEWMFRLKRKGLFDGKRSLLDLGPQDIQVTQRWLEAAMLRHSSPTESARIASFCNDGNPRRDCQADYYRCFGLSEYRSADLDDDRADYRWDLNRPPAALPRFDVVTDFGTAEHVYDIAAVFNAMHRLAEPGGLMLHAVPAFAFPNHGFYTPNPNLFVEFARANGYVLEDFSYVDNMYVRERLQSQRVGQAFNFDALPIVLSDMEDTGHFMNKVVCQFHSNINSSSSRRVLSALRRRWTWPGRYPSKRDSVCYIFDLLFVALRKPLDERPLVPPIQRMEGVAALQ